MTTKTDYFVATVRFPWECLKWLLKRKALAAIVVIVIVAIAGTSYYNSRISPMVSTQVPEYQKTAPATPYIGSSPSRLYCINSYHLEGEYTILTDFYSYDKSWERKTIPLPVKTSTIQITKR